MVAATGDQMDQNFQDGYADGFLRQPCDGNRGDGQDSYDDGYIEGSSDILSQQEYRNGASPSG
jgi:hypothetical protein